MSADSFEDDGRRSPCLDSSDEDPMDQLRGHSITYRVANRNGFDRVSAGLRTGISGKTGKEGQFSEQCAGFGENSRAARDAKWAQQRFNGGGCNGIGPLFVLYPVFYIFIRQDGK